MGADLRFKTVRAMRFFGAGLALSFLLMPVAAEAQQPKAQPKQPAAKSNPPPAAQPAPAQPAPAQNQPEDPPVVYSPWTKLCGKDNQPGAKEVCLTVREARLDNGMFVASAALIEPAGDPKKILRITVPLGMQIAVGTRMLVDQGQAAAGQYVACFPNGCMADVEVNAAFVAQLKSGKTLYLQTINLAGQPTSYPLPLAEFAKANEGPPTDPKAYEAQQQQLHEQMLRKAEEERKKAGAQPGR